MSTKLKRIQQRGYKNEIFNRMLSSICFMHQYNKLLILSLFLVYNCIPVHVNHIKLLQCVLDHLIIFLSFFSLSSACLLQEKEPNYSKIVEYCEEVLLVSPVNAKAHHRKGVALYHLTNYEESMSSLLKADQSGKIMICSTACTGIYDYLIMLGLCTCKISFP